MSDRHVSTTGSWRVARGAVVGACAAGLAMSAHAMAGGSLPPAPVLAAVTLLATLVSVVASRWRWSVPGLLAILVGAQLVGHAALAVSADTMAGPAMATMPIDHAGGQMQMAPTDHVGGRMLLMHIAAALLLAVLLRLGEQGLGGALDTLLLRATRLAGRSPSTLPEIVGSQPVAERWTLVAHEPAHACWSRGPPR